MYDPESWSLIIKPVHSAALLHFQTFMEDLRTTVKSPESPPHTPHCGEFQSNVAMKNVQVEYTLCTLVVLRQFKTPNRIWSLRTKSSDIFLVFFFLCHRFSVPPSSELRGVFCGEIVVFMLSAF